MFTGQYFNPSNTAFKKVLNEDIYVDKSDLIKLCNDRVNKKKCYICSTRSRRFGKSMAIDMLKAYYSKGCDSKDLFEGLNVTKYDMNNKKEKALSKKYVKYMNAFDVVYFDMQWVMTRVKQSSDSIKWIQDQIISELKAVYAEHIQDGKDLPETLFDINTATGKQFVILIDEWDALFRLDKTNKEVQEKYIEFLRAMFKGQAAEEFVALAYITGILPIKKYGTESALNNFKEYTMVEPLMMTDYIGFTENEVEDLCDEYDMDFNEMKKWYDGYSIQGKHIYSPNSVCEAIENEKYMKYWVSTDTYESLKMYISYNFEGLKNDIVKMISGERISVRINLFKNDILVCLAHLGYLAYDEQEEKVFIPNKEVRLIFEDAIQETDWNEVINAIAESEKLMKNTLVLTTT